MIYLKRFNESKSRFVVKIEVEHGDASYSKVESFPFEKEEDMVDFLNYTFDLREFRPNSGYGNLGYFAKGHERRIESWVNKIDNKYQNRFEGYIPQDEVYGKNSYYLSDIEHVWIEIDGTPHNIIWKKALMTNIIDLPKIGDEIKTNAGQVCGPSLGKQLWNRPSSNFLDYKDLQMDWDFKEDRDYRELDVVVTDCRIHKHELYKRDIYDYDRENDREILKNSYNIYFEVISINYVLLCRFAGEYLMISKHGYDPKYELKYHYDKFGLANYYVVE